MATNTDFAVQFDFQARKVVPYGATELPKKADEYKAYREFEQWITENADHVGGAQLINVMFGFRSRVHGAYTSFMGGGGFRNLPSHDDYLKAVDALNRAIADGSVDVTATQSSATSTAALPQTAADLADSAAVSAAILAIAGTVQQQGVVLERLVDKLDRPKQGLSRFLTGRR